MSMRRSCRFVLMAEAALFWSLCCRAQAPTTKVDNVCSIIAHPVEFVGKQIEVRGLLSFVTGDAAPPDLLTGDCSHGILLMVGAATPGSDQLWQAKPKPHPGSLAGRQIWATFSERLEVNGGRLCLRVKKISDVVFSNSNARQQPEALVQNLYRQVVARHPLGLPFGANREIFEPYLSKTLRHRIELARSCEDQWVRLNHGRMVKAPIAWSEAGIFSGDTGMDEPSAFEIERTEAKQDGSFLVYVKLREGTPPEKPWSWEVAVRVVKENGHPLVDDVIYLKGDEVDVEYRLSELLGMDCKEGHWIGPLQ